MQTACPYTNLASPASRAAELASALGNWHGHYTDRRGACRAAHRYARTTYGETVGRFTGFYHRHIYGMIAPVLGREPGAYYVVYMVGWSISFARVNLEKWGE